MPIFGIVWFPWLELPRNRSNDEGRDEHRSDRHRPHLRRGQPTRAVRKILRPCHALLGFEKNTFQNDGDRHIQYYNRHFGFVLRPAHAKSAHDPLAPGLHHFCFRVEDDAPVDRVAKAFAGLGIQCSPPRLYPDYAPDYYSIFFNDPDGIRLEITNYRQERRHRFDDWANA